MTHAANHVFGSSRDMWTRSNSLCPRSSLRAMRYSQRVNHDVAEIPSAARDIRMHNQVHHTPITAQRCLPRDAPGVIRALSPYANLVSTELLAGSAPSRFQVISAYMTRLGPARMMRNSSRCAWPLHCRNKHRLKLPRTFLGPNRFLYA